MREKGTPKTGGRIAGTPNKVTIEMKTWLSGLIDKNRRQMEKDLKRLQPRDRLLIFEKLMQYTVPKMQAVTTQIDFNKLSEEQLDILINELIKVFENDNTY